MSNFLLVDGPPADRAVASDRPTDGEALDTCSCVVTTVTRERLGRDRAIEVVDVVAGSPAARAGLRPEDLLVEAAGEHLRGAEELQRLMTEEMIGRAIELTVVRAGEERRVSITPREL